MSVWHASALLGTAAAFAAESALDAAADQAQAIKLVWDLMLWICGVMYVAVLVGLGTVLWRRRALRKAAQPPALRDETLSRALAAWVVAIVVGLSVLTATSFVVGRSLIPNGTAPVQVRVTGHEWWWEVEYVGDDPSQHFATANEIHLPAGQAASIELQSDDVIHSFWVPNLAGKRDMIPGRVNTITLTPRRVGEFRGNCAEFCGLQHAKMALLVVVDEPAAFDSWRQRQLEPAAVPASPALRKGEQAFVAAACVLCHEIRGTIAGSHAGPDLTHVGSRRTLAAGALPMNPGALAAWLNDPQQVKPGTHMPRVDLGPERLDDIVFYLSSLK